MLLTEECETIVTKALGFSVSSLEFSFKDVLELFLKESLFYLRYLLDRYGKKQC